MEPLKPNLNPLGTSKTMAINGVEGNEIDRQAMKTEFLSFCEQADLTSSAAFKDFSTNRLAAREDCQWMLALFDDALAK